MRGKDKCELLKTIRKDVAEKYDLEYVPEECQYQGDCSGTCPKCEAELVDLQRQLEARGIVDINALGIGTVVGVSDEPFEDDYEVLEGMPCEGDIPWEEFLEEEIPVVENAGEEFLGEEIVVIGCSDPIPEPNVDCDKTEKKSLKQRLSGFIMQGIICEDS